MLGQFFNISTWRQRLVNVCPTTMKAIATTIGDMLRIPSKPLLRNTAHAQVTGHGEKML